MPRRPKAHCETCGRLTAVRIDGKLHPHRHPGWPRPCPGRTPAGPATADYTSDDDGPWDYADVV